MSTYVETLQRKPAYIEDLEKGIFDSLFYDRDPETGDYLKDADGNNVITIGLKNYWIAQKKAEASVLLSKTDWYVVRNAEKTTAIPSAVTTERDSIRTACAGVETKITNAADLDAFIALFPSDMDCF